jgi:peptidoglycan/LPS O-acetylase OafA/YrhL
MSRTSEDIRDHPALDRLRRLDELLQPSAPDLGGVRSKPRSGRPTVRKSPAAPPRSRPRPQGMPAMPSMGYQPALDGLRALSVIAVIFYHAGFSWMHGGFFGVEVFFVVSGFLITSLLLDERDRSGHTNLGQFWLRRARRLLPALFTVLAAVAIWSMFDGTDEQQSQLRRDLPWAVFYGGNWGQIVGGVPYYSGDPPLLRHVWSLAVEEQWYLLWPLVFVALRRTKLSRAGTAGLLAAISAAVMLWTYVLHGNGPGNVRSPIAVLDDVDRINFMYLSTVTRAAGLVLGAAAAFVWRPWRAPGAAKSQGGWLLDGFGMLAVAMLGCIAAVATLTDGYVYQWLLALVIVLSLVAVLVAVHPAATWFRATLSWRPLVEIGKRSYGIYLWHWPVFVFAGAYHGSVARVVVALAVTAVLSEACYRLIELPVRRGDLSRWWRSAGQRRQLPAIGVAATAVAIVAFYASVDPFDRAAGGDDVVFGATLDAAAANQPTTTVAGAAQEAAAAQGPRRLVIVGDSQAHALAINLPDGIDDTFDVTDGSVEGCSVYDEGALKTERHGYNLSFGRCDGWQEEWADAVERADADIALIVLGAWDVFDFELDDGTDLEFGTPEWDDYVVDDLQSGIDALGATGARIALLEVPCMRPQEVEGSGVPALPERGDDGRVEHLNELWRQVADANPDTVTFVPGPKEWCDDEDVASDVAYRWDGVHVYTPGANLIFTTIAPTLLAL